MIQKKKCHCLTSSNCDRTMGSQPIGTKTGCGHGQFYGIVKWIGEVSFAYLIKQNMLFKYHIDRRVSMLIKHANIDNIKFDNIININVFYLFQWNKSFQPSLNTSQCTSWSLVPSSPGRGGDDEKGYHGSQSGDPVASGKRLHSYWIIWPLK